MQKIRILDCTLRDGGCVNNFNFGETYMNQIKHGLEQAKVDIIECGYIDEKNGTLSGRTQFISDTALKDSFLKTKKVGLHYVAMVDYGNFNFDNLTVRNKQSIDGIRLAFHKSDRYNIIELGKKIIAKGYMLYIQPMLTLRYTDKELIEFIEIVNTELSEAEAFYIVDSFGEMRLNDLTRIAYLVDHNLKEEICLGFHSHNNLQLSYSNAVSLLGYNTNRNLIFDSSIMGMGKGAGNLNTELFADHLNIYHEKNYKTKPLLEVIDKVLNQIYAEFNWGYSIEYYLSATNGCTPSYAKYFYSKHMLSIDKVELLLSKIEEHKKLSFDKVYAEQLYMDFNKQVFDDEDNLLILKSFLRDKQVVLLAPGKSVLRSNEYLENIINNDNVFSIALNNYSFLKTDFVFATKDEIHKEAKSKGIPILYLSNINTKQESSDLIFDYRKWTDFGDFKSDNSFFVLTNILLKLGVNKLQLAGFDGFDVDISKNYYDNDLIKPLTKEQVLEKNKLTKDFIEKMSKFINFNFLTKSKYEGSNND